MNTANEQLREKAAIAHVEWAQRLASEASVDADSLLLGASVCRLDELNVRMDTLEELLKRKT